MHLLATLQKIVDQFPQAPYPYQSRIHPLKFHPNCYVKRDDELGFGISGSKIRKYRTLIPFFIQSDIREVIVMGSAFSNHVLGISQLLIENNITPTLFLRGDPSRSKEGNALLTSLFVQNKSIHWFSKDEWKKVEEEAELYAQTKHHKIFVLAEGGSNREAFSGALTLPLDIMRNGIMFDHVFIDSGTGLTAIALILGFCWLKRSTLIHVVLMADDQDYFLKKLKEYWDYFNVLLPEPMLFPANFCLHLPELSFGKTNQHVFDFIRLLSKLAF